MEGVNFSPYSGPEEFYKVTSEARGAEFAEGCKRRIEECIAGKKPVKIDVILREQLAATSRK